MAVLAPSSRGLGHRPFKARTPVRIRLGLPKIQTDLLGRFLFLPKAPQPYQSEHPGLIIGCQGAMLGTQHHTPKEFSFFFT